MNDNTTQTTAVALRAERAVVEDTIPVFDTARFEHYGRIASVMARASLVPDTLKGNSFEEAQANCFQVVELADRLGFSPFAVAQCASIVYGKLMLEGKLVAAALETKLAKENFYLRHYYTGEWGKDDYRIYVTDVDLDEEQIFKLKPHIKFPGLRIVDGSVGEWKTLEKDKSTKGNWRNQPDVQLQYRGDRTWARLFKAAIILGVLTDDEMDDFSARQERAARKGSDSPRLTSGFGKPKEAAGGPEGGEGSDIHADTEKPAGAPSDVEHEAEFEDTVSEQVGETVAEATREADQPDPAEPEDAEEPKTTAQPGEVYLMAGDPIGDDGKRATYKNGQPFSRVSEKGAARLNVHDFHAPEVVEETARPTETESAQPATSGQATSASAKPASSASAAASSGHADRTQASDTVDPMVAIITKIGQAPAYDVGRKLLAEFCITEHYLKADAMSKSLVKGALWDRYCELDVQGVDVPQVMSQIGLMQLWLEFGAKSKAEIDERWQAFFRLEAYKNANEGQKANISKLMMDRKAVLP